MRTLLALMMAASVSLPALAAKEPTMGGEPGMDLTCVLMPEAPAGHFVCEDRESYARCKALEGKGKVRLSGEKISTPVTHCEQGG